MISDPVVYRSQVRIERVKESVPNRRQVGVAQPNSFAGPIRLGLSLPSISGEYEAISLANLIRLPAFASGLERSPVGPGISGADCIRTSSSLACRP